MERQQAVEQNNSISQQRHQQPRKRQQIRKDTRRKDRRKKESPKQQPQQQPQQPVSHPQQQFPNTFNSFQSQTSKYQRLDEFWKVDIQSLYKKDFTEEDQKVLSAVINQKKPSLVEVLKNKETHLWEEKISLQQLYKYVSLVEEFPLSQHYTFVALQNNNKKEHYVMVMDPESNIQKAIEVTQEELTLLAFRQQAIEKIKDKCQYYNTVMNKNEKLSEIKLQISFLVSYLDYVKNKLDRKLQEIDQRAKNQPKIQPPAQVEENYITFLINKNLKKTLHNQEIDFYNHFKKLDINENVTGPIDLKPITEKKDFDEYIRKRKIKKTGKKTRWVLKTACGGCLSYFSEMYNPFSFCSQCHIRYHKYCYIPKNEGICDSCFLSKSNQSKRSRVNECQLCGTKGFLSLSMDESTNAHIFCLLINDLWKFQNTQIIFQKKQIKNAVENVSCSICKQGNSYIYKCECCESYAHPLCAYVNGWGVEQQANSETKEQVVKVQCCNGVEREKNEKRRRFVLNYKKCVFSQCQ